MSRAVGGCGYGKARWGIPEILPCPLGTSDDDAEKRDSCIPQRPTRRSELADMTPAEWTVQATEHGEQDRSAAAILCERHGTLDIGRRELEVWCCVTGAERGVCEICHLSTSGPQRSSGPSRELLGAANATLSGRGE